MRWIVLTAVILFACPAWAQESTYYSVPINKLELVEGKLPVPGDSAEFGRRRWARGEMPYAVLDGDGEAIVDVTGIQEWQADYVDALLKANLLVRAPKGTNVTGLLALSQGGDKPLVRLRFRIPAATAVAGKAEFDEAKRSYYNRLLDAGYAGAGWWRHRLYEVTEKRELDERELVGDGQRRRRRGEMDRTFTLMTGGRALAENLQLRRGLPGGKRAEEKVELATIKGVTVNPFDWKPYLTDVVPESDPLAAHIPEDQFALFFPTFSSMLKAVDTANDGGTPLQQGLEQRAEDALTKERYETQLCLQTSTLARILGPQVINSVAFTASDPFLREGTDVAILFEAKDAGALDTLLRANRGKNSAKSGELVEAKSGEADGVAYHLLRSSGRGVCSYQARLGNAIVVTNSLAQLKRLAAVQQKRVTALGALDEYRFFRTRYTRGETHETAFLVIPDGAIRKWSSPKWRIAMSRRVRAAAVMAELEAEHVMELAIGEVGDGLLDNDFPAIDCGRLTLTARGVESSKFGGSRFLKPIAEMEFTHVTEAEAAGYKRWRDGYQGSWSNFFDPIGIQIKLDDERMAADVTVMPLILGSEYQRWIRVAGKSEIRPTSGDAHEEALFQFMFAFDFESEIGRSFGQAFTSWPGMQPRTNPLRWMGETISIYVDRDPFFAEMARAEDRDKFMEKNLGRFPGAINIDVRNPLIAGVFLTGLKVFVQQAAPNYTKWSTRKHGEIEYVRVEAGEEANDFLDTEDFAIHYATLKGHLVVTLSEDTLKKAIDRSLARKAGKADTAVRRPWLGKHLGLQAHRDVLHLLDGAMGPREGYRAELASRCWKNLPILNEWRRMFPGEDAVAMHAQITGVRLVCPGGGKYAWNDSWKTYESTAFGHPGAPKAGPDDPFPFAGWNYGNFGVTFEEDGIRARGEITRK
ncbi:MAG: hypothetical protein ACYTGZ_21400 [Planctomycetota bacterium]